MGALQDYLKRNAKDAIKQLNTEREASLSKVKNIDADIQRLKDRRKKARQRAIDLYRKLRKMGWSPLNQ